MSSELLSLMDHRPAATKQTEHGRRKDRVDATKAKEIILDALKSGAILTSAEAAILSCAYRGSAERWLKIMHNEKIIHISAWLHTGKAGPRAPAYQWGTAPDVDKPAPVPAIERSSVYQKSKQGRKTRASWRKNPDVREVLAIQWRKHSERKRLMTSPPRDHLLDLMMGRAA